MQSTSLPTRIPVPFADQGSKQTIPVGSQIGIADGRASFTDGFPPLTRTPLAAGGKPPFGTDMNGVLNAITQAIRWTNAGAGWAFDAEFAESISGHPKGSMIPSSDGAGFWISTIDANTSDPEGSLSSGWLPALHRGSVSVALSGSAVTLTALQAAKDAIVLTGTLTANVAVTLPAWRKRWQVINQCTGSYVVTLAVGSNAAVQVLPGATANVVGDGSTLLSQQPQFTGVYQATAGLALTAAHANSLVAITATSSATITLPAASAFRNGDAVTIRSSSAVTIACTIAAAGTDRVVLPGSVAASYPLRGGDSVTLVSDGVSRWVPAAESTEAMVARLLSYQQALVSNGYTKLPGGLIIQWGRSTTGSSGNVTTSFPAAFPNACLHAYPTNNASNTPNGFAGASWTNSTITIYSASSAGAASGAGLSYDWFAIGY